MIEDQKILVALELQELKRKMQNQKYILTDTMIGESLVAPTALTFSLFEMGIQNDKSIGRAMKRLGFPFRYQPGEPAAYERIFGRPYINVTSYTQASIPFWPVHITTNGKVKTSIKPSIVFLWPLVAYQLTKIVLKTKKFAHTAKTEWQNLKQESVEEIQNTEHTSDLCERMDHSLEMSQKFFSFHIATDFCFGGIQVVLKVLHRLLKLPYDINAWDPDFKNMPFIQFHLDLWKLSHEKIPRDAFMKKHGRRSHKDWEISAPRFYEAVSELNSLCEGLKSKDNFEAIFESQQIERTKRQIQIKDQLKNSKSFFRKLYIDLGEKYAQIFILREDSKTVCFDWIALFRRIVLESKQRNSWDDVVFHLSIDELKWALKQTEAARLNDLFSSAWTRKKVVDTLSQIKLPAIIDSDYLDQIFISQHSPLDNELVCLSPGIVEGNVIVVNSAMDCQGIQENHIVVTRFVDPQYIPFMIKAKGWILEQGSLLGHSSILAREALIPVISSYTNATSVLTQGTRILLDANVGEVRPVKGPEAS